MGSVEFQNILVTTDLSEDSVKAYNVARSLKERYGSALTLLSCVDSSMQYTQTGVGALESPPIFPSGESAQVVEGLQRELHQHIQQYFPGITVMAQIRQGPIPVENSIVEHIREQAIDLVVIASHGRSGIRRALLGSVAEYVLRHSTCPVLVVPTRTP